jgi:hypothetical protein
MLHDMFQILTRAIRKRRAIRYVTAFPEDAVAAQTILTALELRAKCAREAAEMLAGRQFSDAEWLSISERWERAWHGIA